MIFVSSDWHFGHKNIAGPTLSEWKSGYRDFDSLEKMNETIINTINKYVRQEDTIIFCGDFCFGGHINTPTWRNRILCGNIHWIRGNHDEKAPLYANLFSSVDYYKEITINKQLFCFYHYSQRVWNKSHKGSILCYGHSHQSLEHLPWGKSMDVGIDNAYRLFGEYRPFSLEEIVKIMDKREIKFVDHHDKLTNF